MAANNCSRHAVGFRKRSCDRLSKVIVDHCEPPPAAPFRQLAGRFDTHQPSEPCGAEPVEKRTIICSDLEYQFVSADADRPECSNHLISIRRELAVRGTGHIIVIPPRRIPLLPHDSAACAEFQRQGQRGEMLSRIAAEKTRNWHWAEIEQRLEFASGTARAGSTHQTPYRFITSP